MCFQLLHCSTDSSLHANHNSLKNFPPSWALLPTNGNLNFVAQKYALTRLKTHLVAQKCALTTLKTYFVNRKYNLRTLKTHFVNQKYNLVTLKNMLRALCCEGARMTDGQHIDS